MNNLETFLSNQKQEIRSSCPVCLSTDGNEIFRIPDFPVISNVLWQIKEDALNTSKGDIRLVFCESCGHVFNVAFDPNLITYSARYENSLYFSSVFQQYAKQLAQHLVEKYQLKNKKIIEIGCGKGDFLKLICELGENQGIGFDPGLDRSETQDTEQVQFIGDTYSEKYKYFQPDFLISRHTLEHIYEPATILRSLKNSLDENKETILYFEVPSLEFMLRKVSVWDIIYEHYSYFSRSSIGQLFTNSGFSVLSREETYAGQFLCIEASSKNIDIHQFEHHRVSNGLDELREQAANFAALSQEKLVSWRKKIDEINRQGKRIVLWGAGTKGISFLNFLSVGDEIPFVVDVNPRKENMFITGSGQKIVPPKFLLQYQPDTIIIMNQIYQQEIAKTVESFGLNPSIIAV